MDGRYLTPEQRRKLRKLIMGCRDELHRLEARMKVRAWYTDDALRLAIVAAASILHAAVQLVPREDAPVERTEERPPMTPGLEHLTIRQPNENFVRLWKRQRRKGEVS